MEKRIVFLLDTNVWLERLLGQAQAKIVGDLLNTLSTEEICMTDFTLHSIGVICNRLSQRAVFTKFVQDVLIDGGILMVSLPPAAMQRVEVVMNSFNLDFDDAYQYVAAEREQATIVSFDKDFDKTVQGRQTPEQVLKQRL
jgi:predicted nucleic acid-binding protein